MLELAAMIGGVMSSQQGMAQQQYQNSLQNYLGALNQQGMTHEQYQQYINQRLGAQANLAKVIKPKEKSMFKEVVGDVKSFILEHRGIIYFIVAALLVDHFFFKGAFKARLQGMADKMVTKVEEKIK